MENEQVFSNRRLRLIVGCHLRAQNGIQINPYKARNFRIIIIYFNFIMTLKLLNISFVFILCVSGCIHGTCPFSLLRTKYGNNLSLMVLVRRLRASCLVHLTNSEANAWIPGLSLTPSAANPNFGLCQQFFATWLKVDRPMYISINAIRCLRWVSF